MLTITTKEQELFDEATNEFILIPRTELHLEHSLISLSKWEAKWKKPFLGNEDKTREEYMDYVNCMCIDKNVPQEVIEHMDARSYKAILDYIGDSNTATKVYDMRPNQGKKPEVLTSEVIYYYMIYFGIPFECQKWHLNRLMMLIKVCGVKGGTTNQAMDMNAIFAHNRKLNAARRIPK